jgi:acyl carrier protein
MTTNKKDEILRAVRDHLAGRNVDADVQMESNLARDIGLDSLDTVELGMGLEEQFGVELPESEIENVESVADLVDLVERKLVAS